MVPVLGADLVEPRAQPGVRHQHSFAQDDTADDPMNRSQRPCRGQVSVAPSRGRVSTCFKPRPVPDEIDVDVTVRLCDGWLQRAGSLTVEPGALGNYAEL